ncbi:MAG: 3'-5' exonuclease [Desulfosarcinaceae bacterium]|nr:3'-5' exonuclease [Desulfosarcinaceae bacterium]
MQWIRRRHSGEGGPAANGAMAWRARFAALASGCRDSRLRAYYRQLPVTAETPIERVPLIALDLETTGLDAERDSIVSIGLIPLTLHRIHCRGARHWLVRPHTPLTETSIPFHGITHSDLASAPAFGERLGDLLDAMAGRVTVVHCHEIERAFLAAAVKELTGDTFEFPVIDTMLLEWRAHPKARLRPLMQWLGLQAEETPSLRLDACRRRYHLPRYRAHHALTDALATAELFQAQMQYHYSPDGPIGRLWR